jgi:hypothetical protein
MRIHSSCIALVAAAMASMSARAVPFDVEVTLPNVRGYVFVDGPGKPGTRFTASRMVLRASGDTQNSGGFGY